MKRKVLQGEAPVLWREEGCVGEKERLEGRARPTHFTSSRQKCASLSVSDGGWVVGDKPGSKEMKVVFP